MMETFDPGPLAYVSAHGDGKGWTLVFVRDIEHSPAVVWAALTEPDQLSRWAPFTTDRALSHPGPVVLTTSDGSTIVESAARVTRVDPPSVLEYTWGDDLLRWDLVATPSGTRLTLSHHHADREALAGFAAGWHLCLAVLGRLLDGTPIAPIRGSAAMDYGWQELNDAYAGALRDSAAAG